MRYVVELPRTVSPVIADACVVCGKRDAPRRWPFEPLTVWVGIDGDLESVPAADFRMCYICGGRLDRRRTAEIALVAVSGLLAGAATWALWPLNSPLAWERLGIMTVGVPLVVYGFLRLVVFRGPIMRAAHMHRIDYRFTNQEFAAEFARVNHSTVRP